MDIDFISSQRFNAQLADAVINNNVEQVRRCLLNGADPNHYFRLEESMGTLLHFAKSGEVAETLLAFGAIVDGTDIYGPTPLFAAVGNKRLDVVQTLLDYNASVHITNRVDSILGHAVQHIDGSLDIFRELITHGAIIGKIDACNPPMHVAVRYNHMDVIEELIALGADVNIESEIGQPTLHVALECPNTNQHTIEKLLVIGANIEMRYRHHSPLDVAALQRDVSVVQLLLKYGANTISLDCDKESTLLKVISRRDPVPYDIVTALLDWGSCPGVLSCWQVHITSPIVFALTKHRYSSPVPQWVLLLLKHSLLQYYEYYTHDLEPIVFASYLNRLIDFTRMCIFEVYFMKKVMIDDSISLCHFLRECVYNRAYLHQPIVKEVTSKCFNELIRNRYPIYNEVLMPRMHRGFLVERLNEQAIFTTKKSKQIFLIPDVLIVIAQHLSNIDLLNLTMAFYHP